MQWGESTRWRVLRLVAAGWSRPRQQRSNQQEMWTGCRAQARRAQPPRSPSSKFQSATGATAFPEHYGRKFSGQGEKRAWQRLKMPKIWKKPHQPPGSGTNPLRKVLISLPLGGCGFQFSVATATESALQRFGDTSLIDRTPIAHAYRLIR